MINEKSDLVKFSFTAFPPLKTFDVTKQPSSTIINYLTCSTKILLFLYLIFQK